MKCEEALTKIEAYIDHTLSGRELEEFLEHVKSCRECYDELETYYIISVGMRYLEEENLESYNIPKMLQEDLHTRERQVRRRNIFRKTDVFWIWGQAPGFREFRWPSCGRICRSCWWILS